MIDLVALSSLRAVQTHGSVTGAAEALGYTPSAVSQQIKRLEHQTGVALLERVGRGVMLTALGRRLVEDGASVLTDLELLESSLRGEGGHVGGRLRVATFSTAMRGLVAPAVGTLLGKHPDLVVALAEREPWEAVALVGEGQVDLAVVHSWGDLPLAIPDHLDHLALLDDVADVIVPSDHLIAGLDRVSPADLLPHGWIATPEGTICRQWLLRMYDGTGHLPVIAHQAVEFDSHVAMVGAGLGIALIPRLGRATLPPGVVAVAAIDPVPTRTVSAVYRRSMVDHPAVRVVLEALSDA
jgi:DNA-binding transcriptional LysR family regulator